MTYKNGDIYEGKWSNNYRNGKGKLIKGKTNIICEGKFVETKESIRFFGNYKGLLL
jgi:hypothetical protein